jgi:phospholysine phosphohistidine inorganic pyrophosphate phosphatase
MPALLIDLDGVIYEHEELVPRAPEAIAWIEAHAIPFAFVTNTTSRPRHALVDKLARFGIHANESQILTPAAAALAWLRTSGCSPTALFVPTAARVEFEGVPQVDESAEHGAASVIIGDLGTEWTFATLNRAFRLLMADPAVVLVALGMTRYWCAVDGLRLDVGPFIKALEHATGRSAVVLGKPSPEFFNEALRRLGCTVAANVVMVGDDIVADVQSAQNLGMRGVLVRTGKFREADLASGIKPDAVLNSIADLPSWWHEHIS